MNRTDSQRRLDEGATFGNCRMNLCFLRTNWYSMRGSSQQGLQHAFDQFSAACDQEGTKISSEKIEVLCLLRRQMCILQARGNAVEQVETFKQLGVIFTSEGIRSKQIDTRIGKANSVLRELYCSVVTKRELSITAKLLNLSLFRSSPVVMNLR